MIRLAEPFMEPILEHHRHETQQPTPLSFLRRFPGYFIQYFDDTPERDARKALSTDHFSQAEAEGMQRGGCGVYFTPNAFVGARRLSFLQRIQAVFLDVDCVKEGHGLSPMEVERRKTNALLTLVGSAIPPHAITETKNGLQPIWRVQALEVERGRAMFREAMGVLLRRFEADPGAKDPARVLRLPGFLHLKDPGDPFRCRLLWNELDRDPEDIEAFVEAFHVPPVSACPRNATARPSVTPFAALDVEEVIRAASWEAGIAVTFRQNGDGSRQIVEDGEVTSGFVSSRGNFCHSASGKARRGGPMQLVQYYLGLDREAARRWLADRFGLAVRGDGATTPRGPGGWGRGRIDRPGAP